MSNDRLKTSDYFLYPSTHDFGYLLGLYLGPVTPKCPDDPNTIEQVKLYPQLGFILE